MEAVSLILQRLPLAAAAAVVVALLLLFLSLLGFALGVFGGGQLFHPSSPLLIPTPMPPLALAA